MVNDKNRPDIALIGDINQYKSDDILRMANILPCCKVDVIFDGPSCQIF